jgi:hypothetical protein
VTFEDPANAAHSPHPNISAIGPIAPIFQLNSQFARLTCLPFGVSATINKDFEFQSEYFSDLLSFNRC